MNVYLIEWWAKERMGEIQAAAVRERIAEALKQKPPLRVALGLALIRLGQRLRGAVGPSAETSAAF